MGIVLNQSFKNTVTLILGFAIGGVNTLFLYTRFLKVEYYGLVIFLLSTANILLPLVAFGMQHSVVKYFSSYKNKSEKDSLLTWSLVLPLFIVIPITVLGILAYDTISDWVSEKNPLIKSYTHLIFWCAISMAYFEVFYAWTKVQLDSVFGNFIQQIFARLCASILLIAVYFNWITTEQFIYGITIAYFLRMLIMMVYALKLYIPEFTLKRSYNFKEILRYSMYLILAGSAGTILLEIDKFMIPQMEMIAEVAYYSVGVYIASVVAIPSRAMQQITNPITAKYLNENNLPEVEKLYKQSSINLLIVGGLLFLLINLNIVDMYKIIDRPEYSVVVLIVLMISFSELYKLALGINGAILTNSKYYKMFFYFSIGMATSVIVLNKVLIVEYRIDGAALATLLTILLFNTIKIWYIKRKFDMQPFTTKTLLVLCVVLILYFGFYYINISENPFINIILKSVFLTLVYSIFVLKSKVSKDINDLVKKVLKK
jgi:O-antigen/teichoic acid export membrane protein